MLQTQPPPDPQTLRKVLCKGLSCEVLEGIMEKDVFCVGASGKGRDRAPAIRQDREQGAVRLKLGSHLAMDALRD